MLNHNYFNDKHMGTKEFALATWSCGMSMPEQVLNKYNLTHDTQTNKASHVVHGTQQTYNRQLTIHNNSRSSIMLLLWCENLVT